MMEKIKMGFNVIIGDNRDQIQVNNQFTLTEVQEKWPELIKYEGDFWTGTFWQNYHFLFCQGISDIGMTSTYFITDSEFSWEKVIKHYPELWENKLLLGLYQVYQRGNKLNYLLGDQS